MSQIATVPTDIEALADSLSDSAEALHKRVMAALRRNPSTAGQEISHEQAQALFEQEVALRQHANRLYTQAVRYAAAGLPVPAAQLLGLAARARERIRRIDRARELAGIAASLLGLAAALAAQHPEGIGPAVDALKEHVEAVRALDDDAPPAAGTGHTMDT